MGAVVKHVYLDALIESYIAVLGRLKGLTCPDCVAAHDAVCDEINRLRKLQTDAGHADYYVRKAA